MGLFRFFSAIFLASGLVAQPIGPTRADSAFETYGDVMQFVLPATALGISLGKEDYNGSLQFAAGALTTFGVTMGLKAVIDSERPNGNGQSFPSGHTSAAFSGASFLHYRYGWEYGMPAYAAAAAVGISRVTSENHHWYDVVGGAVIANGIAYVLTDTLDDAVVIIPIVNKSKKNFQVLLRLGLQF